MLQQWCSYLRRHAFQPTSTEDDADTAEVGITMALEDVQQAGTKIYGNDFQGDPLFRLEQVQVSPPDGGELLETCMHDALYEYS